MSSIPEVLKGERRGLLGRLILNGLAQAAAAVATAWLVKWTFDHMLNTQSSIDITDLVIAGAGLVCAALAIAWLRMRERIDAEWLGQHYATEVRLVLYDRLSACAPRAFQKRSHGGVALRFVGDMTSLRRWVSLGLARLTVAGIMTIGALTALALLNWPLALTISVILLIGFALAFKLGGALYAATKESRRRLSHLAANVNEKVATMAVVQVFGQTSRERDRMARQTLRLQYSMISKARAAGHILAVTEATAALATAAALMIGVIEVTSGTASAGTVVAALSIIGILIPPLRDLGRVPEYWHGAQVSREKLIEFLDTPSLVQEIPDAPHLQQQHGKLEFDAVSVAGGVSQFSATLEAGTVVALVGPNGAGKSTLLSLAARLVDPDQGAIRLDDQILAEHSLASIRRAIGMAGPDFPLLRGTIEKNLLYRWPDAPIEEIERIQQLCAIDDIIATLPAGLKSRIAEGGAGLSVGQRQRIALARALLGNPALLLLDEVDANLDPKSSLIVDRVLKEYSGTVLQVTHRLEHVRSADVIWYLEQGRLIESGPPAKLLNGDGPTARLFRCQLAVAS